MLLVVERVLRKAGNIDDGCLLEDWLPAFGDSVKETYSGERWHNFSDCVETVLGKNTCAPQYPSLDYLTKHIGHYCTALQWQEDFTNGVYGPPKPVATPMESPAVTLAEAHVCAGIPAPAQAVTEPLIEPPVFDAKLWTAQQLAKVEKTKRDEERIKKVLKEYAKVHGKPMFPWGVAELRKKIQNTP
jgi:hypothetical protein